MGEWGLSKRQSEELRAILERAKMPRALEKEHQKDLSEAADKCVASLASRYLPFLNQVADSASASGFRVEAAQHGEGGTVVLSVSTDDPPPTPPLGRFSFRCDASTNRVEFQDSTTDATGKFRSVADYNEETIGDLVVGFVGRAMANVKVPT